MKVAQNDETNPNTRPVRPPHIPSIANIEPFPSGSAVRKCQTSGKHSRMLSPSHVSCSAALEHVLLCTCLLCIYYFSPLFSPVDPETAADAPVIDYITDDPSSLSVELPGKPPL